MTITFLGTRGNIDASTRRHRRHTATLVSHRGTRIMIDCGADWLRHVKRLGPDAVVLTHAHPDHVDGLRNGAPCAVYAPAVVWNAIDKWPIRERHELRAQRPVAIDGVRFMSIALEHSVIAPAVGYRIGTDAVNVFYAPDVLSIPKRSSALKGVTLYIGDGATISRPIVRIERQQHARVGHESIVTQLDWCARAGIPRAIFTHCGRAIVAGPSDVDMQIARLGRAQDVDARVAYDGLRIVVH